MPLLFSVANTSNFLNQEYFFPENTFNLAINLINQLKNKVLCRQQLTLQVIWRKFNFLYVI